MPKLSVGKALALSNPMTQKLLNNRYQVIQVLGSGGFGETFLAEDTHMPSRRRCVIKQLKPVTNDPQMYQLVQQRFQREAAILEYLGEASDQIPNLYAYFSENGQFYLVQEWIQGQTLTSIVQGKGAVNEQAVRDILVSLLSVLDYVHSKGIIHRDIKPDNIILRSSDGKPVLIDFGAVKETMVTVGSSPSPATQSMVIGTPGFMPSEQVAGRPLYATDIYSLGLTAIYLLTGTQPQELQVNPQTGELLWQQYTPTVSPHLAMVLNKAIQPHSSDRYTTSRKMLEALQSATFTSPRQPATRATVNLSPAAAPSYQQQPSPSPQNSRFIPSPSQRNWQNPLILSILVAIGLIGAVAIAGINRKQQSEAPIATSPTPETPSESSPGISSEFPPASEPADPPITAPPLRRQRQREPVVPPVVSAPEQDTELDSPEVAPLPEGSVFESENEPVAPETAAPPVASAPQPETGPVAPPEATQPPVASAPPRQRENQNPSTTTAPSGSVPAFPTGTSESTVVATLGNPSKTSRGLWNTRAAIYNLEQNRIDLGYLYDRNSGMVRQTEASFAPSIQPQVMQGALQQMLAGNVSGDVSQGLQRVYQRQTNKYSFQIGDLKGVIQRNERDRIYIGVWDADLH